MNLRGEIDPESLHDGQSRLQGRVSVDAEGAIELLTRQAGSVGDLGHALRARHDAERLRNEGRVAGFQGVRQEGRDFIVVDEGGGRIESVSFSAMRFAPFLRQSFRPSDIARLAGLVAAAQQDDDRGAALLKVDPITGAVMNPQLADAFADGGDVAGQTLGQAQEPGGDERASPPVPEPPLPKSESLRLLERGGHHD